MVVDLHLDLDPVLSGVVQRLSHQPTFDSQVLCRLLDVAVVFPGDPGYFPHPETSSEQVGLSLFTCSKRDMILHLSHADAYFALSIVWLCKCSGSCRSYRRARR